MAGIFRFRKARDMCGFVHIRSADAGDSPPAVIEENMLLPSPAPLSAIVSNERPVSFSVFSRIGDRRRCTDELRLPP
jgi:hypothetical protein